MPLPLWKHDAVLGNNPLSGPKGPERPGLVEAGIPALFPVTFSGKWRRFHSDIWRMVQPARGFPSVHPCPSTPNAPLLCESRIYLAWLLHPYLAHVVSLPSPRWTALGRSQATRTLSKQTPSASRRQQLRPRTTLGGPVFRASSRQACRREASPCDTRPNEGGHPSFPRGGKDIANYCLGIRQFLETGTLSWRIEGIDVLPGLRCLGKMSHREPSRVGAARVFKQRL